MLFEFRFHLVHSIAHISQRTTHSRHCRSLPKVTAIPIASVLGMSAEEARHLHDVRKSLRDNADYAEADDQVKAGKFATALKQYILAIPQMASRGSQGEETRFDIQTLKEMLKEAETFLAKKRSISKAGFRLRGMTRMPLRSDP